MIRFGWTGKDGRKGIGLGLWRENVTRLMAGKPVFVAGETVRCPGYDLIIYFGETEYELTEQLASLIGKETEVRQLSPEELPPGHPRWRPRERGDEMTLPDEAVVITVKRGGATGIAAFLDPEKLEALYAATDPLGEFLRQIPVGEPATGRGPDGWPDPEAER